MMKRTFYASAVFALTLLCGFSISQDAHAQAVPAMPAPLETLAEEGAQVRYLGNDLGMNGWLVVKQGQQQFFYESADKKAVISGVLFNQQGEFVTAQQLERLQSTDADLIEQFIGSTEASEAPVPDAAAKPLPSDYANLSPAEQLYLTVEHSNWVSLGDENAPVVYSFIDPKCPHCHNFVNELRRGYLKRGMVQLRLVPVGLIDEESMKKAAFLLSAADAEDRFYNYLDGDNEALPSSNTLNTQGVELNIDVMRGWGLDVTPFSIYRDASNKVKILKGLPERMETLINDLP